MICVATTIAPYKLDGSELNWLRTAEEMFVDDVHFFAAIENVGPAFDPFLKRLAQVRGEYWTFNVDDGQDVITSANRLHRICMGRNLIIEFALTRPRISHVLFLDSDLIAQGDCVSKLLELDAPLAGGDVPSYCLTGPAVRHRVPNVQRHWNTAGFLMVRRDVLRDLRWGHDPDAGETDDPWYQHRAVKLGYPMTLVRKDVLGLHTPLVPVEQRPGSRSIR